MMEETAVGTDGDESLDYDSLDERPAERWAPLGAANDVGAQCHSDDGSGMAEAERLTHMEEEQDQLNSSLLALTTHFAQVQFRLKQIVDAPAEEKETLLKDLEEFAFKGIPDVRGCKIQDAQVLEELSEKEHEMKMCEQRRKQQELISQLKSQLEDLETYAYETGDAELPTNQVIEKQSVIIDQLKRKLDLQDVEHLDKLSTEDLRRMVDHAIGQIVNPAKVKEKLLEQLKTQIVDLERFIEFLQGDATSPGPLGATRCTCPVHGEGSKTRFPLGTVAGNSPAGDAKNKKFQQQTLSIMRQALTVLQIFAISQFGCGGKEFQRNLLKRTTKGNHWGDLRARLEITITKVADLAANQNHTAPPESDYASDTEDAPVIQCNQELVSAVRKELAMALKDLLQHGLMEVGQSSSVVPFGCFPSRRGRKDYADSSPKMMHAWDLITKFYDMKHGKEYNDSPARKLSQSFSLDIVGGKAITAKQTLLSAVEEIQSTHERLKRSEDSRFKAFVCLALNQKKLVVWLRMILRNSMLIEYYYQPWSYVVKTGFDDALVSLDKLSKLTFNLPMDLAVRPFNNIRDAF